MIGANIYWFTGYKEGILEALRFKHSWFMSLVLWGYEITATVLILKCIHVFLLK